MRHVAWAVRSLTRTPLATAASLVTLALAIGANTAIFSVVYGVLMRPLPFRDPSALVQFTAITQPDGRRSGFAAPEAADWSERLGRTVSVAAYGISPFTITGDGDAEALRGAAVSAGFFDVLAPTFSTGRPLGWADEDTPVVVLSDGIWHRRFAARADIVGQRVTLNARPYTVIGVAPRGFHFPADDLDLWTPLGYATSVAPPQWKMRGYRAFSIVGRLTPGVTLAQAKDAARSTARWLAETYPRFSKDLTVDVEPLREQIAASARPALLLLLAAAGIVLVIGCANVAGLALVRASGRTRDTAIRAALGANRRQLVTQFVAESTLLSAVGGAGGLVLAEWVTAGIVRLAPAELPRLNEIRVDLPVLLFTLLISVAVTLVCGTLPGILSSRLPPDSLRESRPVARPATRRMHRVLVVAEIALALVLLTGATLLARSLAALTATDAGVQTDRVLTLKLNLAVAPGASPSQQTSALGRILDAAEGIAGVRSAAVSSSLPPHVSQMHTTLTTAQRQSAGQPEVAVEIVAASADLFSTLGVPVLRGRAIGANDTAAAPRTLVVSETAARRLFPGQDLIGQRLAIGSRDPQRLDPEIVGVVGDVKYSGLDAAPDGTVYLPYAQRAFQVMYLVVRTAGEPVALAATVRRAILDAEPFVAVSDVRSLAALSVEATAQPRFRTLLLGALAGLALLMAAVGLYGVIAHAAASRTTEIGIRMALGAGRVDVVRLVMREGVVLTAIGLAAGLIVSMVVNRALSVFLFGIAPGDPLAAWTSVAFVAAFAVAAALIPAINAARLDPLTAVQTQ